MPRIQCSYCGLPFKVRETEVDRRRLLLLGLRAG